MVKNMTAIVDVRVRRSYGHGKPLEQWEVMLKDHREGYIEWTEFERNQATLAGNNYHKPSSGKAEPGGQALLAGSITCARCGRRLPVSYIGRGIGYPVYLLH